MYQNFPFNILKCVSHRLMSTVIIAVIVVSAAIGLFVFLDEKNKEQKKVKDEGLHLCERISDNLISPVWDIDEEQIERSIDLEMSGENVLAIVLRNEVHEFRLGKIKTEDWTVVDLVSFETDHQLDKSYYTCEKTLRKNGEEIGSVEIYMTDHFLEEKMRTLGFRLVLLTLGIASILIIAQIIFLGVMEQKRTEDTLRLIAVRNTLAEEKERRTIALGLHDTVGQNLAIALINASSLKKKILTSESPVTAADIEKFEQLLETMVQQTKSLTFELSTPILYDLGLIPAIDWLAEEFNRKFGLVIRLLHCNPVINLGEESRIFLFRIVRELLFNIVKHADAAIVEIVITEDEKYLTMQVKDDGKGFDPSALHSVAKAKLGAGLFSIRNWARSMGGSLHIESGTKNGTTVLVNVPVFKVISSYKGEHHDDHDYDSR
ncbi:MAG: sensor histidine kinase [Chitinivibrionales bacterium]|nr:sensor histidine kinase [Chitinivibrionales bacterium]